MKLTTLNNLSFKQRIIVNKATDDATPIIITSPKQYGTVQRGYLFPQTQEQKAQVVDFLNSERAKVQAELASGRDNLNLN